MSYLTTQLAKESSDLMPPCDLDAERATIGSILLDPERIDDVTPVVTADDFYDTDHANLFRAVVTLHNECKRPDVATIRDAMKKLGQWDAVIFAECARSVPHAASAVHYAGIVREQAMRRKLLDASSETIGDVRTRRDEPATELVAQAESRILSIADRNVSSVRHISEIMVDCLDRIQRRIEHGDGLSTGYGDVDQLFTLRPGELVIGAGRPGMGKTAFALNVVANVFEREVNACVHMVSLEMGGEELGDRIISRIAKLGLHRIQGNALSASETHRINDAAAEFIQWNFIVDDAPIRSLTDIAAGARRTKRKYGLSLVVVDYLQLVKADDQRIPRHEQVAAMSRRLKAMARELSVPVLCLCQLNRQSETSTDKRPRLSHLRESGAIEQDADVVFFVHRDGYYQKGKSDNTAKIIVDKQRNGPTGEATLTWAPVWQRFDSLSQRQASEMSNYETSFEDGEW